MSKLPEGWLLSDLESVTAGITDGTHAPPPREASGSPLLSAKDVLDQGLISISPESRRVSRAYFESEMRRTRLAEGDVLLTIVGTIGRSAVVPANPTFALQRSVAVLKPVATTSKFTSFYLRSPQASRFYSANSRGTAQQGLYLRHVKKLPIPVPPLNEQRRIVAAIEEQFSRIDAADDWLRRAAKRLDSLRRAALEQAVAGPWPLVQLGDLIESLRNGIFVSRPAREPPGTAIFRISAVRPMTLDTSDVRYAVVAEADASNFLVREGDLLFTRYSGNPDYVGACARIPRLPRPTLHPDKLIRVVVDRQVVDPAFVELACAAGHTLEAIRARRKTTAGQVGIAGGQLKSVPIPVPPMEDQERIVGMVARHLSGITAMREAMTTAEKRSAALRRSILERAFRGELAVQEDGDEPASSLLERLRADRGAAAAGTRRRVRA